MEYKICTKCKKEFPAILEYWHKQEKGKFGLRSICKVCSSKAIKEYRKKSYVKENHRIRVAEWRKRNPEKEKEIRDRCYIKNKERFNKERRDKYKNDPEYKRRRIECEKRYKESGRRYEMNNKPEQREKARKRSKKRRSDPIKKEHDYKRMAEWRDENRDFLIKKHREKRKNLAPSYVAQSMRMSVNDITPEIYETKKLIIQLKRELKNNNIKIR